MACNEDLKKAGGAYPRTCADCGLGPCKKYAKQPITSTAWVLWHMYGDGSSAHVERAYTNEKRAKDDFALLNGQPGGASEWKLNEVPIYGHEK